MAAITATVNGLMHIGNEIINAHVSGSIVVLSCTCAVFYRGRAETDLPHGNRVVVIKPDGSTLVHGQQNAEPLNWQPAGADISIHTSNDTLVIEATRSTPVECLKIHVTEIHDWFTVGSTTKEDQHHRGSESDMRDAISRNPSLVEEELTVHDCEYSISVGRIDVLAEDGDGNTVVIELKRRTAGPDAVSQLQRYVTCLQGRKDEHEHIRGILVAPNVTDTATTMLRERDFEFRQLNPLDVT